MNRLLKYLVLAFAGAMISGAAQATVITSSSNNPLNFSWSYNSAAGVLSGFGSMNVSGFGTNNLTLAISLANTSALDTNRLTSFGFGIDPNLTSVTFSDAADQGMINAVESTGANTTIPNIAGIEVCAFGGPNCKGGGPDGIDGGGNDSFTIVLGRALGWGSSVDISPIAFKYQTGVTSYEFTTNPGCASTQIGACSIVVPEAGSLPIAALSLLGLLLAGFIVKSRKRTTHARA